MLLLRKSENREEFLHEDIKKMSLEEKQTMKHEQDGMVSETTRESRLEEEHKEREQFNKEVFETRQSQKEQNEDGTFLILTEAKTESREAFSSQSHDSKHFEHTETTITGELHYIETHDLFITYPF
jgi:hypothetical protein